MEQRTVQQILSERITEFHGGARATLFNSGMSAIVQTVLTLARTGDEIVASENIRSQVYHFFKTILKDMGITVNFIRTSNPMEFESAISFATRFIFIDTEGSVYPEVLDIEKLSAIAHRNKIPLIVDTGGIPLDVLNPIKLGADIVVQDFSFVCGSDSFSGGAVIERGKIDWRIFNVPLLKAEDSCCKNIRWAFDLKGAESNVAFSYRLKNVMKKLFDSEMSDYTASYMLENFGEYKDSFVKRSETALTVAEFLKNHEKVSWIIFPELKGDKSYSAAVRFGSKFSTYISFALKSEKSLDECVKIFFDNLNFKKIGHRAYSEATTINYYSGLGDSCCDEEFYTNPNLPADLKGLIRIFIGTENAEDIVQELKKALDLI